MLFSLLSLGSCVIPPNDCWFLDLHATYTNRDCLPFIDSEQLCEDGRTHLECSIRIDSF